MESQAFHDGVMRARGMTGAHMCDLEFCPLVPVGFGDPPEGGAVWGQAVTKSWPDEPEEWDPDLHPQTKLLLQFQPTTAGKARDSYHPMMVPAWVKHS